MQSEVPSPNPPETTRSLPPVAPPSGKHILQLFLVPGLIVVALVFAYLGWRWLTLGWYTPEAFLKKLDNPDPDVRWRAADDLAQVLLRDDGLASNPQFGLDLAERLQHALAEDLSAERSFSERAPRLSDAERDSERKTLEAQREYVEYLCACLGNFMLPVGVPVLNQVILKENEAGVDPVVLARQRRHAVYALANLGENLQRMDKLPAEKQPALLAELDREAASGQGERSDWARQSADFVRNRSSHPTTLGVDAALARCAAAQDPFLREMTAVALKYWSGEAADNARIERTLWQLQHDDGHGSEDQALAPLFHDDEGHGEAETPLRWGLIIRSQAAVSLLWRASAKVPMGEIQNLLNEQAQLQNFRRQLPDGREEPDETVAYALIANTLAAVAECHHKDPGRNLSELRPAIEQLTKSSNAPVRTEAERTLITLGKP
ncbi:MAG: hypothetical protein JO112_23390 [Planctomycetes bacterium]|nr:hypothetical protein [Planctomycetota bacterium]